MALHGATPAVYQEAARLLIALSSGRHYLYYPPVASGKLGGSTQCHSRRVPGGGSSSYSPLIR